MGLSRFIPLFGGVELSAVTFLAITIVDKSLKLAKRVEFMSGFNVITTSQQDGNDRGKSVVVRSLYHALGAESKFDTKFNAANKVFILEFLCGDERWTILRMGTTYSLYDFKEKPIWKCYRSRDLARRLFDTFGFRVMLPNRVDESLELAPPAFSYLSSYIDQEGISGSEFDSFNNLGQYKNAKADLFYTYVGAIDDRYYELVTRKRDLVVEVTTLDQQMKLNNAMILRVDEQLGGCPYAGSMESLLQELTFRESEYSQITAALASLRKKLMVLRDEKADRERSIQGAEAFVKRWDSGYRRLRLYKECPLCRSRLDDDLEVRVEECETREDVLYVKHEMKYELDDIERKIAKAEDEYRGLLDALEPLRAALRAGEDERRRALMSEGLVEMRDGLVRERYDLSSKKIDVEDQLTGVKHDLNGYQDLKRDANDRLAELLKEGAMTLGLEGIDLTKIKGIQSLFKSNGSNAALATLVWYLSINEVQRERNPSRVRFPMVIDSPMSGEQDDEKKRRSYEYIISSLRNMGQVILTGLAVEDYAVLPEDTNCIVLNNEKYHLLNEDDYEECNAFLDRLIATE